MKKILIILWLFLVSLNFSIVNQSFSACDFKDGDAIQWALHDCFEWENTKSNLVTTSKDWQFESLNVSRWFKEVMQSWIQTLWWVLAILAVGSIVYGSLLLVLSGGEEEKLKKWKDVVKWSIIWFLGVVFAGVLITIVVNIMFSI